MRRRPYAAAGLMPQEALGLKSHTPQEGAGLPYAIIRPAQEEAV